MKIGAACRKLRCSNDIYRNFLRGSNRLSTVSGPQMTAAVIIQARMNSKRFPGKVLADLCGKPVLWHVLTRCLMIEGADMVVLAVPDEKESEPLADLAKSLGVSVFRGPEPDVLKRYLGAARLFDADIIMRITADCPLIDPVICGEVLAAVKRPHIDYASNLLPRTFERGLDCEAFTRRVLEQAAHMAMSPYDREHVTPWMQRAKGIMKVNIESGSPERERINLCVDYPGDLKRIAKLMRKAA